FRHPRGHYSFSNAVLAEEIQEAARGLRQRSQSAIQRGRKFTAGNRRAKEADSVRARPTARANCARRETARAANASWRLLPRRNLLKRRLCRQRVPHLACRSRLLTFERLRALLRGRRFSNA